MYILFYRNPRLLILAVSLIVVSGLSSFYVLPRMEDPQLTERAANVNTIYPGAKEIFNGMDNNCDGDIDNRFVDMGDGTVLDRTSGLTWLKNANAFGAMNWDDASAAAAALNDGEYGLTDGSIEGDWRLPTIEEWEAFVDANYDSPALSNAAVHLPLHRTYAQGHGR